MCQRVAQNAHTTDRHEHCPSAGHNVDARLEQPAHEAPHAESPGPIETRALFADGDAISGSKCCHDGREDTNPRLVWEAEQWRQKRSCGHVSAGQDD